MSARKVRAAHAKSWYPIGNELVNMLNSAFSKATVTKSDKKVKAIISPHAGYFYCLETAAYSYAAVDPSLYNRVLILGPSHVLYTSKNTIADADCCETPFGDLPIDTKEAENLIKNHKNCFTYLSIKNSQDEHSLEMQLPLIKKVFGSKVITILPVMIGDLSPKAQKETVQALKPIVDDPNTLVVVSSDFCHWGRDFDYTYLPEGTGKIYERIEELDKESWVHIKSCNHTEFANYIERTGNTICGAVPIEIVMEAIGTYEAEFPKYSQSERITKPWEGSVSYSSGIFRI